MNIKIAYALMASTAMLALGSCSEGKYWNEPDNYGEVVAFAKPAASVSVPATEAAPDSYDVTLYRSQTDKDLTVDVAFATENPDVFSGPATATFKAGESTTTYTIQIGDVLPGLSYSVALGISNPEGSLIHVDKRNLSFTLNLSQALVWSDAGTAQVTSLSWVENVTAPVKVEEGNWPIAGQRLFRLVDTYFALEPEFAVEGDYGILFLTDDAGKAIRLFDPWSYMGESDDESGEYYFFGCPAEYGGSFTSEGSEYKMAGIVGYSDSMDGEVTPGWYETLVFDWTCPAK